MAQKSNSVPERVGLAPDQNVLARSSSLPTPPQHPSLPCSEHMAQWWWRHLAEMTPTSCALSSPVGMLGTATSSTTCSSSQVQRGGYELFGAAAANLTSFQEMQQRRKHTSDSRHAYWCTRWMKRRRRHVRTELSLLKDRYLQRGCSLKGPCQFLGWNLIRADRLKRIHNQVSTFPLWNDWVQKTRPSQLWRYPLLGSCLLWPSLLFRLPRLPWLFLKDWMYCFLYHTGDAAN